MAILGWQGFSFEHPDDWALAAVTGRRSEGYLRLASPGRIGCHVRWKHARSAGNLHTKLDGYFATLQKDAKKGRESFQSDTTDEDGGLAYRWLGAGQGRGRLFYCSGSRRVYFLEVVGGRKDSLLPHLREIAASFSVDRELWSVFGLGFVLPKPANLESKSFLSGRTRLSFRARGARIEAERWAFGDQLVEKHGLEGWAKAAIPGRRLKFEEQQGGLAYLKRGLIPTTGLVRHDAERNQLVVLQVRTRKPEWRPAWDWLDF